MQPRFSRLSEQIVAAFARGDAGSDDKRVCRFRADRIQTYRCVALPFAP